MVDVDIMLELVVPRLSGASVCCVIGTKSVEPSSVFGIDVVVENPASVTFTYSSVLKRVDDSTVEVSKFPVEPVVENFVVLS